MNPVTIDTPLSPGATRVLLLGSGEARGRARAGAAALTVELD